MSCAADAEVFRSDAEEYLARASHLEAQEAGARRLNG
jgi:hypothetical protein